MKNIEVTLKNKFQHLLNKHNLNVRFEIAYVEGCTIDDVDEFTGDAYTETYPDRYDIAIEMEYREKYFLIFDKFVSKLSKKNSFDVDFDFTS